MTFAADFGSQPAIAGVHSIRPIMLPDGKEYYVLHVHRSNYDDLLAITAGADAYDLAIAQGRNWRRAKREMNKTEAATRRRLRATRH